MPGVIDADMGGGGPLGPKQWQESNVNRLTDLSNYDPISGFPVYKALLCDVVKLGTAEEKIVPGPAASFPEPIHVTESLETPQAKRRIYLDHNATAPLDPEVMEVVTLMMKNAYGNASSIHAPGSEARLAIESARRHVAQLLNCTARRIIFTGGGSEADNLAIKGAAFANRSRGNHIITSSI